MRVSDVAGAVRLLMSGEDQISTFKEGSEQYPVTMRLMPGQRDDPAALSRLLIPSAKQGLIRLDSIAKLERGLGPSRIDRYNRQFAVGIYGNVAPGHSLGEAATATQNVIKDVGLPPGYTMAFSGSGEDSRRDDDEHVAGVRPRLDLHVHGAGRAVREPCTPVRHSSDAAAVDPVRACSR